MFLVVCFSEFLTNRQKFGCNKFDASGFKAFNDLADQSSLYTIWFN